MRLLFVLSTLFLSLLLSPVLSAPKKEVSHSHNGRVHKHLLPASGKKHFHKHMHNGRAHIHPFSAEIGFNHTHNKKTLETKKKSDTLSAELNKVQHTHGGKPHSHVLPPSGVNHLHRHWHGKRSHKHSLTDTGAIHFHPENEDKLSANKKSEFDKQITELLKRPVKKVSHKKRKKKYIPKKKQNRVKKLLPKKKKITKQKNLKPPKTVKQDDELEVKLRFEPESEPEQKSTKKDTDEVVSATRQYEIGLRYEKGLGTSINLKQAFKWYTRAAKQGETRAQINLASLYENGRGVKRSLKQAVYWYKKAAENRCECSPKTE